MKASEAKKISSSVDVSEIKFRSVLKEIEDAAKRGALTLLIKKSNIKDIEDRLIEYGYSVYQYQLGPEARHYKIISWQKPTV